MKRRTLVAGAFLTATVLASPAQAASIPLTFAMDSVVGGTTVFKASLTGIGLTQIASVTIVDANSGTGGSPGIFSGFDVDAIFIDADGSLATAGDRTFGSSFLFNAGTTRPTGVAQFLPNAAHPGPTFGSINATTVDFLTATLNTLDGIAVADVATANGFLTLGDGGSLAVDFLPAIPVGASLFLMVGEVGLGAGEGLDASVFVADTPAVVPEPSTMLLLATGLGAAWYTRRRRAV